MRPFRFLLILLPALLARAEVHSLTLQQALAIAARQNPEVMLARLDDQRAREGVRVAKDPFTPKVYGGSGLAYTYGYPNSIEGNAPSLFEAKTDMAIYDRPKMYQLSSAKETARGTQFAAQAKADDVAYRTASLFLDAKQAELEAKMLSDQVPALQTVINVIDANIKEGTELPIELRRSKVSLAQAQQRLESQTLDEDYYQMLLAVILGFPASDRVVPQTASLPKIADPTSEDEAMSVALRNNKDLRQMESTVLSKELELRSYKAMRLPRANLVAQYALFAKYNYEQYFQKFQRNNGQIGASITIPLLIGSASRGYAEQAIIDMQKIRVQMNQVRNRVITDTRRSYQIWKKAQTVRDLAQMQLDLARENLTVLLAQKTEGRALPSDVEKARVEENNRWLEIYEAETQVTRAQLSIMREMGTLMASLDAVPREALP